jgi:diguanylate cyclase (GGDEF)-like protein/PAS domain S-box-containing protein
LLKLCINFCGSWRRSIRRQLIAGFSLAALALLLGFGYLLLVQQREFLLRSTDDHAISLAHALSISGTSWALSNDLVGLQEVVQGFAKTPDLQRAYFLNTRGEVLASTNPNEIGYFVTDQVSRNMLASPARDALILTSQKNLIVIAHPVMSAGHHLGWVRVEMTRDIANANLSDLTRSWLIFVLIAMLSVSMVAMLLARRLTHGLNHLMNVAAKVEHGHDDLRLDIGREDEIGVLARHLDRMLDALDRQKAMLRSILDSVPDLIFIKDTKGVYLGCNKEVERLLGHTERELIGKTDQNLFDPAMAERHFTNDRAVLESGIPSADEEWLSYPDSSKILVETRKTPFRSQDGTLLGIIGVSRDISERKKAEEQIRNLAFYDTLTNLPNRRLLLDRLGQVRSTSKRTGRYAALIFLDLDNFKPLNDTHGHNVGDLLLIEVAHRITNCVRETDTVSRFGGDEFIVMLSELTNEKESSLAQARLVAEKIRATLAAPYLLTIQREDASEPSTVEHHCTSSMGVVLFTNHEASHDDLIKWADMAMYQAKEEGRNRVHFFEP